MQRVVKTEKDKSKEKLLI